jgi:hypothetical protein
MSLYLRLPNYVNNLLALGFTDQDIADGGSDRLVDAVVAWGDESAVAARVGELLDSGADHVVVQPLGDVDEALAQLEALAPALVGASGAGVGAGRRPTTVASSRRPPG